MPEHALRRIGTICRKALAGDGTRVELRAALILILDETRRADSRLADIRGDAAPSTTTSDHPDLR